MACPSTTNSSCTLAILGTGALSAPIVQAHAGVIRFDRVLVRVRRMDKAQAVVDQLAASSIKAEAASNLQSTLHKADVVAALTTATVSFIRNE